eukprot:TRINITY_DN5304_c0_g1_i1.p4 TRINITY_DN5304_c0_g1~~TRINITY_DN5304_c0_g1_i1.p4  ORF type:complete len:181 (-),score=60.58 TRINITY_DN5304_c0_g1_i1:851-1393(-)
MRHGGGAPPATICQGPRTGAPVTGSEAGGSGRGRVLAEGGLLVGDAEASMWTIVDGVTLCLTGARVAAEELSAHLAAEGPSARLAAAEELSANLAAEEPSARLAAAEELSANLAAEEPSARLAAEEPSARLAAAEELSANLAAEEPSARLAAAEELSANLAAAEEPSAHLAERVGAADLP